MQQQLRVFGENGTVMWLVQTDTAEKVQKTLDLDEDRVSGLVLAGPDKVRTVIIGVYGISGATTASRPAQMQQALWEYITPIVEINQLVDHNIVVLGDLNVIPAARFTTSARPLRTSIDQFDSWARTMHLESAMLVRCPGATLDAGFFTRSKHSNGVTELSWIDHILASPGMTQAAAILIMPAGAAEQTEALGDHDAIIADLQLGFAPSTALPRRQPTAWAHFWSPQQWDDLNTTRNPLVIEERERLSEMMAQGTEQDAEYILAPSANGGISRPGRMANWRNSDSKPTVKLSFRMPKHRPAQESQSHLERAALGLRYAVLRTSFPCASPAPASCWAGLGSACKG
jgi:hypothetical protein